MEEKRNESYNHVLKYTWIFGGVQGIVILISLVRNKFMALLLGAGGIGFNALLVSAQNFASQCTNMGISFGAVPRLSDYYEQQRQDMLDYYIQVIRLWSLIASLLGFVFCIVISPLINDLSFTWGNHTLHYAMLALAVAMIAITGGETAILKATRRLGSLARIQIYTAVTSVFLSVPLYYFFEHSGVVPAIVLIAGMSMLTTILYSYRCYPLRLHFSRNQLKEGAGMVKLGLSFVLAAAIGSAAEMLIRAFLNVEGSLNEVGLYNVGYMLTITYAGIVFSSMETDYFPRLSAVSKDIVKTNEMVNKQMEVSLLLLSPMLVVLLTALPILVPLLFSAEFLPVVSMAQVAVLAMYFKVLSMPIAYVTLARSYSLSYLLLETSYFVVLVTAIVVGFRTWGIWGTGLAIVIAHVAELMIVGGYAYWQYHYCCTWTIVRYAMIQMLIGFIAYAVSCLTDNWLYWITEAALILISTAYSIYILRQKTHLWEALMRKFKT
ncbi:MAG: oligosaccharide flippase family protein [Prevotella sp.]|nr:oligosaccharide flippase family protein [Prevotella sp.]